MDRIYLPVLLPPIELIAVDSREVFSHLSIREIEEEEWEKNKVKKFQLIGQFLELFAWKTLFLINCK